MDRDSEMDDWLDRICMGCGNTNEHCNCDEVITRRPLTRADTMDYRNMDDKALRAACKDDPKRWADAYRQIRKDRTVFLCAQFIENVIEGSHDARAAVRKTRGNQDQVTKLEEDVARLQKELEDQFIEMSRDIQ